MTKKEMQRTTRWNIEMVKASDMTIKNFHDLQDLSASLGGKRWCNMEILIQEVVEQGTKQDLERALGLYAQYNQNKGKDEALRDYLHTMNGGYDDVIA